MSPFEKGQDRVPADADPEDQAAGPGWGHTGQREDQRSHAGGGENRGAAPPS